MSTITATFHDFTPGRLQRQMKQTAVEPHGESIFSDMADGNLATEFIFSFAGFSYAESQLILTLCGIIGDGPDTVKLFDEEVAKIASCNERTVRRWRKAYLEKAKLLNFWPLEIIEGELCKETLRYLPTAYRITFADTLEQIVRTARASAEYRKDRVKAIERASSLHYEDIEQAPPKLRKRKPQQAQKTPLTHLRCAAKNLGSAQNLLGFMTESQRAAFVNRQRESLRETLDAMRKQMAEIEAVLSGTPATVEDIQVKGVPDKMSGTPPPLTKSQRLMSAIKKKKHGHKLKSRSTSIRRKTLRRGIRLSRRAVNRK